MVQDYFKGRNSDFKKILYNEENYSSHKVKAFSEGEIVERIMVPMAMEMVRCLDEKIVASPQEADIALSYGLGFPRFRGGICRWMDEVGLENLCALGDRYSSISELYRPSEALLKRAKSNQSLYD